MTSKNEQDQRSLIVETVTHYQSMILAYAYSVLRDFHLAENVFQDVSIILSEKWDDLPHDEQIGFWLKETTRRKSLETLRKQKRFPVSLSEDALEVIGQELVHTHSDDRERERLNNIFDLLHKCLDKLGKSAYRALELRYGEGDRHSCEDIAAIMGKSVQSVYSITKRSRLAVARCVNQGGFRVDGLRGDQ